MFAQTASIQYTNIQIYKYTNIQIYKIQNTKDKIQNTKYVCRDGEYEDGDTSGLDQILTPPRRPVSSFYGQIIRLKISKQIFSTCHLTNIQ